MKNLKSKINASLLMVLVLVSTQAPAQTWTSPSAYHLDPPPEVGSEAFLNDLSILHAYQLERTTGDCALAGTQSNFTLDSTFGPKTGIFTEREYRKAKVVAFEVAAKMVVVLAFYKHQFHRLRPYAQDKTLTPCIATPQRSDLSYPSGHAAMGYALALALSREFPEKREAIMRQGIQIGENRLIGGVHYPSDVTAGRLLATEMFEHLSTP